MKAVSLKEIKKELDMLSTNEVQELCLRLSRFKKENKELNSYLAKISNNIQLDITTLKDLKTRRLQVVEDCKKAVLNFQNNTFDLKTNLEFIV